MLKNFALTWSSFIVTIYIIACEQNLDLGQSLILKTEKLDIRLYTDSIQIPVIVAHRGASRNYPENTLAAIRGAIEENAGMFEFDVMFSKDEIPVLIHDEDVSRTTNGSGKIFNFTLSEIKALDAGLWFSPEFSGEKIPTLKECLNLGKDKIAFMLELKPHSHPTLDHRRKLQIILNEIYEAGVEDYVVLFSFDPIFINILNQMNVNIPRGLTYTTHHFSNMLPSEICEKYSLDFMVYNTRFINEELCKDMVENDIKIFIHTIFQKHEIPLFKDCHLFGYLTDSPRLFH
jgi:glycerophosphoryl diester phosphodiesterase